MSAATTDAGRRRRLPVVAWILIGVVVLVGLYFAADAIVRRVAEQRIAAAIVDEFPESVTGGVRVGIGGPSVIAGYLLGRIDRVELVGEDLTVEGVPVRAKVVATGVPVDTATPLEHGVATLGIDEAGLNELVQLPVGDGAFTIDDGTIGYRGTVAFLGLELGYTASATAEAAGTQVLLTPVSASVDAGGGSLDLSGVVSRLLDEPIAVCTAERLPAGVEVAGIELGDGEASIRLDARDLVLDPQALRTPGAC